MFDRRTIDISFGTMLKAAALVILLWAIWILRDVVSVILLSIVIASSIEPVNHWFSKYRVPRVLGVIFIYLGAFAVFASVFYFVLPPLLGDALNFIGSLPSYIDQILRPDSPLFTFFPTIPVAFGDLLRGLSLSFEKAIPQATQSFSEFGARFFGGALSFILLIVISFYLSVQEHGIENFLRIVTPLKYESYILDLWRRSQTKIGRWLQGQILLGVLVGVIVFLGLTILDIKYALLLAILTAVFEIIPVFGPIMAALPAISIAATQSLSSGIWVLLLYILVQQFENHLIYPLVVRKTVGVPPLLVVISLVVGGTLGGFFGILLAVPAAAVLVEFLNDVAARKVRAT